MKWILMMIFLLALTSVSAYSVDNLIAYYSFDNQTNLSVITDDTGNSPLYLGRFATINNFTINTSTSGVAFSSDGINNNSLRYTNVTSDDNYESNLIINLSSFTLNFWLSNLSFVGTSDTIIKMRNGTIGNEALLHDYVFKQVSVVGLRGMGTGFRGNSQDTEVNLSINVTNWTMVTIGFNSPTNSLTLYVDGIYRSGNTILYTPQLLDVFDIVRISYGNVDEISIWDEQLSILDIQTLYDTRSYASVIGNASTTNINSTTSINYTENYTLIDGNYFSKFQCVNSANVTYVCNNTIYNPLDNSFGCNLDDLDKCDDDEVCLTYIFNSNKSIFNYFNPLKTCTQINTIMSELQYLPKLFCTAFLLTSPPLYTLFQSLYDYNCTQFNYYTISESYCDETTINNFIGENPLDTYYTEGQCQKKNCVNFCSNNTYKCGSLQVSLVCSIQSDGCTDWTLNSNCRSGDICNFATGLCSPIIKNNTCQDDADCPINMYCHMINATIGECQSGTRPSTESCDSSSFINGCGLKSSTKYIIVFFTMIVTIIGFFIIGTQTGSGSTGFYVGMLLAVFELIIFTVMKWIQPVVLIVLIVVSIALSIFVAFGRRDSSED